MTSYILREWTVTSALHLVLMASAMALSFPSILAPALTGDHPDIVVTEDEFNSIMGAYGMSTFFGFIIVPVIMQRYGRKATNVFFSVVIITGSAIIALATNATALVVARIIHGLTLSAYLVGGVIAAEYTHPKRRGFHIIVKGVSGGFGDLISHSLGLSVLSFRQTALLAIVPAALAILITLNWPESPQFLAHKGRYEECASAFEWLRGTDIEAKKELQELIRSQKERDKDGQHDVFTNLKKAAFSKTFWMPMFITFLIDFACSLGGFLFMASYVTEIIHKMTEDRNKAYYYTLAVDVLKIISVSISSLIVRVFKRRTLILSSGLSASIVMVVICVLYYLNKMGSIDIVAKWVLPSLFVLYFTIVNTAIAPTTIVIQGELIPFAFKGIGTLVSGMILMTTSFLSMTYTWQIISILDIHGTFSISVTICIVSYITLYFFLPETKDKTLQDIENEFSNGNVVYDEINADFSVKLDTDK